MTDPCPPFPAIRRLEDQTGSAPAPDPAVEAHLERCPKCRELLNRLARDGFATGPTTLADPSARIVAPPEVPGLTDFVEIGRGGSGVVFRARRETLGDRVAVKLVAPGGGDSAAVRDRAVDEARAAIRVRHPNVARTFDVGLSAGGPYIVMEFFEGGTLAGRLGPGGVVPAGTAARLTRKLAEAVAAIHREGLLHGDLKPSNVLLTGPPGAALDEVEPVVGDFGLAREIAASPPIAIRGTPGYMAPERVEGRADGNGRAADVFALGAVLFRLVVGRPPFAGGSREETLRLTLEGPSPSASEHAAGVPPALDAIIAGCLARRPGDRYSSADAVAEALGRFLEDRPAPDPRRRRRRIAAVAVATAAAVAAGFAIPRPPSAVGEGPPADVRAVARLGPRIVRSLARLDPDEVDAYAELYRKSLNEARAAAAGRPDDSGRRGEVARLARVLATIEGARGDAADQLALLAEAEREAEPRDGEPRDVDSRVDAAAIRYERAVVLIAMRRYDQAVADLERCRSLLRDAPGRIDAADLALEASFQIARAAIEDRGTDPAGSPFASVRDGVEAALRERPGDARVLRLLAEIEAGEGRFDEAVAARRRRAAAPAIEGEDESQGPMELVDSLLALSRFAPDAGRRAEAAAEAAAVCRDELARVERRRPLRPADPDFRRVEAALCWFADKAAAAWAEARRAGDAADAGVRLAAVLAAEARDGRPPVDGGRLAALAGEFAAERRWLARPETRAAIPAFRSQTLIDALAILDDGLRVLDEGGAVAGRLRLAESLETAATIRRVVGNRGRALRLSEIARDLAGATPAGDPAGDRLFVLAGAWTQTAKTLWDLPDRTLALDALRRAVAAARELDRVAPDRHRARIDLDAAVARLAHFEREGGDFAAARADMASRRPLWPPGSARSVMVEDACRAIEEEWRLHASRDVAAMTSAR